MLQLQINNQIQINNHINHVNHQQVVNNTLRNAREAERQGQQVVNELVRRIADDTVLLDKIIEDSTTELNVVGRDFLVADIINSINNAKTKEELVAAKLLPALLERAESQHRYKITSVLEEAVSRVR